MSHPDQEGFYADSREVRPLALIHLTEDDRDSLVTIIADDIRSSNKLLDEIQRPGNNAIQDREDYGHLTDHVSRMNRLLAILKELRF